MHCAELCKNKTKMVDVENIFVRSVFPGLSQYSIVNSVCAAHGVAAHVERSTIKTYEIFISAKKHIRFWNRAGDLICYKINS